jgi:hypothetical protein
VGPPAHATALIHAFVIVLQVRFDFKEHSSLLE